MSKVLFSSPSTVVTNSFLIGLAALVDLRNFFAPSILGVASDIFSLYFLVCTTGNVPSKEAFTAADGWGSTQAFT
jgi:hypothetical protein